MVPIGRGGTAVVYRARQVPLNRMVAVKVFTEEILDNKARKQFESECREIGALSQIPGVVQVHHAGISADRRPYLVMELCPSSLQQRMTAAPALSVGEIASIGTQIAATLDHVHRQGSTHRDITPSNILFSPQGVPLLADFGLSVNALDSDGRQDAATWQHAAPEVWLGAFGLKSDVYGLGSTLFTALTGAPPVPRKQGEDLATYSGRALRTGEALGRAHGVPDGLLRVLHSMLASDPDARPGAGAAALALAEFAAPSTKRTPDPAPDPVVPATSHRPPVLPHDPVRPEPSVPVTTLREAVIAPPAAPRRPGRTALVSGTVALTVVVGAAIAYFTISAREPVSQAPVSTPPAVPATGVPESSPIALREPTDKGTSVELAWSGPAGWEYAVSIAEEGAATPADVKLVSTETTFTVDVDPGKQYCFQVQGSPDGSQVGVSEVRAIRGAKCTG